MSHQKQIQDFTPAAIIMVCLSIASLVCGQNPQDTVTTQAPAIDPALNFPRTGPMASRLVAELFPNHETSSEGPALQPTVMPEPDQKPSETALPLAPNPVTVANITQPEPSTTTPLPVTEKQAERSLEVTSQLPEVTTTTTTTQPPTTAPTEVTSNESKSSEETSSLSTPLKTSNGSINSSEEVVTMVPPNATETSKSDRYQIGDASKAEPVASSASSALSPVYLCPAIIIIVLGVTLATMLGCNSYRRRRGAGNF